MPANILRLAVILFSLSLSGCSNDELPKWFSGEPTQAEINAYTGPIGMPAPPPKDAPYPNLADVPPRPTPAMTTEERQNEIGMMKEENAAGQAAINAFNAQPAPTAKKAK